jgi:uncharacterized membrane protein YagU involved in acid resistance
MLVPECRAHPDRLRHVPANDPEKKGKSMSKRIFLVGVVAGVAGGLAMAAAEMIYGWASSAHTAWDAPMGIWAYIGGLDHFGRPVDHIGPIVLGIGGHMLNAILVAIVFVALMRALRYPRAALILGPVYGAGLWALQRYVFLPINTPQGKLFTTGLISPAWVWWIAHVALGTTIGLVYVLLERRLPVTAMQPVTRLEREPALERAG